ncbi:MAG: bile acid:sodium symporter family protein [Flavobacteriaceae bacterium]|nr:bile acid:sodium symporter family protein [Flavobacteriaceae bacterium]MDG1965978.1 bile acid:sodium symporter family protein [Flavobacteriaceae bacterium]
MQIFNHIPGAFPWIVLTTSSLSLYHPPIFTWFSGQWITLGLGGIMLGMGLTLRWEDFRRVTQTPKWVLTGLLLQFTVMPFMGWLLARAFDLPPFFAVGLILVASCPGGTASNVIVFLSRSNLALSVSMTALSTMAAIVMTPLLTSSLSGNEIDVDAMGLFYSTLKVVLVPVVLGVFLNAQLPRYTQKIQFYSPSIAVILITLIVASIIGQGKEIILSSGVSLIFSIMTLHLIGFVLGYFLSKFLLKDEAVSRTISVEVGMQNSGLGVVLAKENFVNPAVAIPAAISSLVHSLYGSLFVALFRIKVTKPIQQINKTV